MAKSALAVHGGAGTILRSLMTPGLEAEYRKGLSEALRLGWDVLKQGGPSLDAVEAAVTSLEDFPLFNAGRGAVFTSEGRNELDASIMDGATLKAGAVAFVKNIRNPVRLARLVMERTDHIMLAGEGAQLFAEREQVEKADDAYFFTDHRWQQLLKAREEGVVQLDHTAGEAGLIENSPIDSSLEPPKAKALGTVGAVACDANGHLAAATSTGGMTNKKFGRIGDTPIIGSGTYADEICAVSCTGHGEYFMVASAAYDVAARMRYRRISLEDAALETIERLTSIGGEGGLISVDANGSISMPFNSDGMYRGYVSAGGMPETMIYAASPAR